jgi:uncharacterized protein GlcG (DUF336 family)
MVDRLVPIASSLSLEHALAISANALALRKAHDILPLAVVVLDAGANLVSFQREDGCGPLRFDIALGALGMGISSRQIRDRTANRAAFQNAVAAASQGRFVPVPGGVLILNDAGQAIGAVGISGDASDRDEYCAIEAIKAVGLIAEPSEPAADWKEAPL